MVENWCDLCDEWATGMVEIVDDGTVVAVDGVAGTAVVVVRSN